MRIELITPSSFLCLFFLLAVLDLGFEQAIRHLIGMTDPKRQTMMFSATWPQQIQALGNEFLNNPIRVTVGSAELTANHKVKQIIEVMEPEEREHRLLQLLKEYHSSRKNRVLLFVLYKKEAVTMERLLLAKGWNVKAIHGDKSQAERLEALECFKDGSVPLMIATDVAARGLDIPNVEVRSDFCCVVFGSVSDFSFPLFVSECSM